MKLGMLLLIACCLAVTLTPAVVRTAPAEIDTHQSSPPEGSQQVDSEPAALSGGKSASPKDYSPMAMGPSPQSEEALEKPDRLGDDDRGRWSKKDKSAARRRSENLPKFMIIFLYSLKPPK